MTHPFVSMESFSTHDGGYDWKAYRAAQIANGDTCQQCGAWIMHPAGRPTTCVPCLQLGRSDRCRHDHFVRCPKCWHTWKPDVDLREGNGPQRTYCPECEHEFRFELHIQCSYTSPPVEDRPS